MRNKIFWLILIAAGGHNSALAQMSSSIELRVSREGTQWRAEAEFNTSGQKQLNAVRLFKVNNNEISFTTTLLEAELRFLGKLDGDAASGTVEGFQGGARTVTGTWELKRQGTGAPGESVAGDWVGTVMLQPSSQPLASAQPSDLGFNATVARPAYPRRHPTVLFDEAHNNADTSKGRYKPFVELITNDGYSAVPNTGKLSKRVLALHKILIIVNATGPSSQRDASAFSAEECDAIRDWVRAGGSLLLISDHAPYSAAVAELCKRFEIGLTNGYTIDRFKYNKEAEDHTELLFTRDDGLLGEHPITRGRDATERINRIITFTGTSIKGPSASVAFLKLANTAMDVLPPDRKPTSPEEAPPDHKEVSAAGRAQGIAMEFGLGRVVVLSEGAMLTAQVANRGFHFGMNVPGFDNRQLALNIMHWLSSLLK